MAETEDPMGAIAEADASELAGMVGKLSDEQLAEGMADPGNRKRILDEIFNRMAEHVDPAKIADLDAVIHFVITDAPGGGADTYEAVFKDGAVTVNEEPTTDEPKVAITAPPVPFLKLVTGQESGPAMFMTGKLKIKGDLMFASQMASFFAIPSGS
ncbi:MAG: SCP2 sterol-binding domain-containing protein [Solirubrobacterales bacterium]|nr:SCP2 sterol-binding domain-containing protein [Solirubrobacterales bacterium]